ncbi:hypothetical protein B0H11DRAFT_2026203 [Mycena galericulata]|nr:hypothetical protein B0H11DRAFT_2026203 [Mycena galericulata]
MRIALLIAFASVAADEWVMFADACQPLHHLVEYPKLVKLVANTPAPRFRSLALPYDDPDRIAAMRAPWPHWTEKSLTFSEVSATQHLSLNLLFSPRGVAN